ncbi:kappa-casein, partial [Sigmodon hispidus]
CREKKDTLYDQKRILKTSVPYVLNSNLRYEPNYYSYPYIRPSVAVLPRVYYPLLKTLLFIRSPAQIYNWQPTPNFPQPTGVPHPIPSPSFLAIPPNENADNTAIPNSNTISPVESAPVPITEPVTTIVANPEASTVTINNPETATAPESSRSA